MIAGKELARSWDTPLDDLADLPALAARTPYVLSDGVLVRRRSLKGDTIAP